MRFHSLAHLSDLHFGARGAAARARALLGQIERADHVVITGDITHRGLQSEYDEFRTVFGDLLVRGRVTLVPGNHDRGGDDVGQQMMPGARVRVVSRGGLYLVRVDSTAEHNRASFRSHGVMCQETLEAVDRALDDARPEQLCAILLHHHPLPLPTENLGEWFSIRFGWPFADELTSGKRLLQLALGRCDLVLHGHRHVPRQFQALATNGRLLRVYNAGSSTELGAFRVFHHRGGELVGSELAHAERPARHIQLMRYEPEAIALPALS